MYCAKQIEMRGKQNVKKIFVFTILICFLMFSLYSEAFLLTHAEHEHNHNGIGGSCTVCVQFQNAENLFKQFGLPVAATSSWLYNLLAVITFLCFVSSLLDLYTPVELKTRLNN